MKRLFFSICLLSANYAFAVDTADIIWTWGNGKSIAAILSFIYYLVNIDTMAILIKYSAVIGFLVITVRELLRGTAFTPQAYTLKIGFFFAAIYIIVNSFLTVSRDDAHKVYILSANELSAASWAKCRPVNGSNDCYAPIAIKLLYTAATNIERSGIGMMESAMMDANALTYSFSRMGLGFGFSFYDTISKNKGDPYTYNTFMEYYENCIIYDLADGTKTVDGLYKSNDLSNYILSTNSRLTNVYSASNPSGTLKTCYEVSSQNLWGNITCQNTASKVQAKSKGTAASEGTTDDICEAAQNFGQTMFNSTKDASAQIEQRTIMNLTNEAIVNSAVASGIDPNTLAYGTAMADREQTAKWMTMGIMAKEWIPSIRGMTQGIALGLTWALAILSIMTANPAPYIGSVIGFQVTLTVWSFILALINFMTIDRMTDVLPNIFISDLGNVDQMTLWSQPTFDEENQKALAFLGYMAVASYGVAQGLVKIGGNALASLGSAIGQLSVGMGTSANMAKGHFDGGLDKSDSSGSSHVNRFGEQEKINPDNSRSTSNLNGMHTRTNVDGAGTKETTTSINGKGTTQIDTTGGNSAKYDGNNVTGVKLESGTTGQLQSQAIASASKEAAKARVNAESAEHTLQNATQSQHQVATDAITTASKAEGTDATVTKQEAEKRAFSKSLDEMVTNKEIDSKTAEKLKQYTEKTGHAITTGASFGLKVAGIGAEAGVNTNDTWEKTDVENNKDAHQTALEKSFTDKFTKNYAHEASTVVSSSSKIDATLKNDLASKINDSFATTQSASDAYKHAQQVSDTATKKEAYVKQNSASIAQDMGAKYLQEVADKAGGGEAGKLALRAELNKLENRGYAEESFSTYLNSIKDKTNVDAKINDTQTAIDTKKSELAQPTPQNHQENQDTVTEQHWLNQGEVKNKQVSAQHPTDKTNVDTKINKENLRGDR